MTADVVGLYSSIPHSEGLGILKKHYEKHPNKKACTEDIGKMAEFVLKNNSILIRLSECQNQTIC